MTGTDRRTGDAPLAFTPASRRVVVAAQEQARQLGHNAIGPEHVLLALLRGDDADTSTAHAALDALGVRREDIVGDVESLIGRGSSVMTGNIPVTLRTKKALSLAGPEATRLGVRGVDPEHLFLGLVAEADGIPGVVLARHGVDLDRARTAVATRFPPPSPGPTPRGAVSSGPARRRRLIGRRRS